MKPKVSIILPVYNMAKYISRCLDSLINQQLTDIEIIAVNDGSTDSSLKILNEYANFDNRIIVINKNNEGVSSARNKGIQAAHGDYIGFVDPDDWINKEMYQVMYQEAVSQKADIVMCSYIREFGTHSKEKDFQLPKMVSYQGEEVHTKLLRRLIGPIDKELAHPELLDAWGTVWSKLYRADIIKQNCIEFTDLQLIGSNEDSLFNIEVCYYTSRFLFVNQPLYHYWRVNEESETTGYRPDLLFKWLNLYRKIDAFLEDKNLGANFQQALNNRISMNAMGLGLNEISQSNNQSAIHKVKRLKTILEEERIEHSFQQLEMKYFPLVWRVFYYCAKTKKTLSFYLMLMSMEKLRKLVR